MFVPQKPKDEPTEATDGEEFDAFAGGFPVPPPLAQSARPSTKSEQEGSRG